MLDFDSLFIGILAAEAETFDEATDALNDTPSINKARGLRQRQGLCYACGKKAGFFGLCWCGADNSQETWCHICGSTDTNFWRTRCKNCGSSLERFPHISVKNIKEIKTKAQPLQHTPMKKPLVKKDTDHNLIINNHNKITASDYKWFIKNIDDNYNLPLPDVNILFANDLNSSVLMNIIIEEMFIKEMEQFVEEQYYEEINEHFDFFMGEEDYGWQKYISTNNAGDDFFKKENWGSDSW